MSGKGRVLTPTGSAQTLGGFFLRRPTGTVQRRSDHCYTCIMHAAFPWLRSCTDIPLACSSRENRQRRTFVSKSRKTKTIQSCSELSSGMYCRVKWLSTAVHPRRQFSPPWELEISQYNHVCQSFAVTLSSTIKNTSDAMCGWEIILKRI
jgi:hypothetical protein